MPIMASPFGVSPENNSIEKKESKMIKRPPTSSFNHAESESSFINDSESSESESIEYNINIKSSKGTQFSKQQIVPVDKIKNFKRSQTKISRDEKNSMDSQNMVKFMKLTARNLPKNNEKHEGFAYNKAVFLNTKELKSRGSTDNGIIVNQVSQIVKNNKKFMYNFGKSRHNRSLNLFKVAKQLHKSMDENIVGKFSQPAIFNRRNSVSRLQNPERNASVIQHRWETPVSKAPQRIKIDTSVNLLKLAKQTSEEMLNEK